jgi:hypothetical protein
MRIYEVAFDHDINDKRRVATHDGLDAFYTVGEWSRKEAIKIRKELQAGLSKKEREVIDQVEVDRIEYLYHVDASAGLTISAI